MVIVLRCVKIPGESTNLGCWSWSAVHGPFHRCFSVCCLWATNRHTVIGGCAQTDGKCSENPSSGMIYIFVVQTMTKEYGIQVKAVSFNQVNVTLMRTKFLQLDEAFRNEIVRPLPPLVYQSPLRTVWHF